MRFKGRDVFKIRVPRSGVSFSPQLEWRLAARWGGYTFEAFTDLDGDDQAMIVGAYRASGQIEAVIGKAQADETKRKQPKRGT